MLNKAKIASDWVVPLPGPDGSQNVLMRARKVRPPQFLPDAKVSVTERKFRTREKKLEKVVMVSFPVVHAKDGVSRAFDYKVDVQCEGKIIHTKFVFSHGQFWVDEKDVKPVECPFRLSELPKDWKSSVKFTVTPRDSFGNEGRSLIA